MPPWSHASFVVVFFYYYCWDYSAQLPTRWWRLSSGKQWFVLWLCSFLPATTWPAADPGSVQSGSQRSRATRTCGPRPSPPHSPRPHCQQGNWGALRWVWGNTKSELPVWVGAFIGKKTLNLWNNNYCLRSLSSWHSKQHSPNFRFRTDVRHASISQCEVGVIIGSTLLASLQPYCKNEHKLTFSQAKSE